MILHFHSYSALGLVFFRICTNTKASDSMRWCWCKTIFLHSLIPSEWNCNSMYDFFQCTVIFQMAIVSFGNELDEVRNDLWAHYAARQPMQQTMLARKSNSLNNFGFDFTPATLIRFFKTLGRP